MGRIKDMLDTKNKVANKINELIAKYKYKPLPDEISKKAREWYENNIPNHLDDTKQTLFSSNSKVVCRGFTRIVIGDYGAYVEFSEEQANTNVFTCEEGEEYRISNPRYKDNVKYEWLTIYGSKIKIYKQKKTVVYADYKPGMYYVSVYEVF